MAWFWRRRGKHESEADEQVAVETAEGQTFGATAGYPRFDAGGRPIVEFSPAVRTALGLDDGLQTGLAEIYRSQAAVRLCVDFLADNIAHCKLKVYRKTEGGREEVPDSHPLRKVLEHPSAQVSGYEFIRDTVADKAIYGNAYWAKRQAGAAEALVRVQPPYVSGRGGSPVAGPTNYIVDVGGGPVALRPDEVVHFRNYNPEDVRVGTSILEALQSIVMEERAASRHRRGFWRNSARHEGWIKRPKEAGHWSRDQRREFRADWQEAMSGPDNAGKVAILEDGMELNPGSFSPKDSEFIEGRNWGLDLVATAYHIPLAALSRGGTFTFASMKEFHVVVYVDTLGPWMADLEKAINVQLVPDYNDPGLYVEFNIEEKLQGDFETQAAAFRQHVQVPDWSVNDSRIRQNKPPFGDPKDTNNPFNWPARPANYTYEGQPAPPQIVRSAPAALDEQLLLELEETANGHH